MNKPVFPECKTVILVNGVPASGKSTVTRMLADHFRLPYLSLDGIKEPFMARADGIDRALNRKMGCAAYEVIWSVVRQSPPELVWIIDAWFGFQPREVLQKLLAQAGVEKVIEVWNRIPPELAVSRYAARLHQRRKGHPGEEYLPELARLAGQAEPQHLGAVFVYDQASPPAEGELFSWIDKQAGS